MGFHMDYLGNIRMSKILEKELKDCGFLTSNLYK